MQCMGIAHHDGCYCGCKRAADPKMGLVRWIEHEELGQAHANHGRNNSPEKDGEGLAERRLEVVVCEDDCCGLKKKQKEEKKGVRDS